jgi:TonB-linked SusC/RagA family outer membrane protein
MILTNYSTTNLIGMKKLYNCFFILLLSLFCAVHVYAQNTEIIRGRIIDKKDQKPVSGATIAEIDADNRVIKGTQTDIDGNFALKITDPKNRITISYIGYKTVTQSISGKANFNISLDQEGRQMENVVVISVPKTNNGNLTINQKDITHSIAKIDAKDLEEMGSASIDQALQGRLAGVDIVAPSGDPGAGMSIRIRGTSSINAGSNPLIVVDGMPYETSIPSDFNFGTADEQGYASLLNIAPSDIKEIAVLKDAAATAMWGSRAANGVLLITTKRGTIGRPTLTYTLRGQLAKQPKPIPLLNGAQYSNLIPEMVMNRTGTPLNTLTVKEFAYDPNDPYWYNNYSQNTDWLDAITQTGYLLENNISMTGGGEKARYFASLGYLNQIGTTIGTGLNRITTRINLDYNVSERIHFRTDFSFAVSDNDRNYVPTNNSATEIRNVALNKMPNMSIYEYNEQGIRTPNFFSPASNIQGQYPNTYNPVALAEAASNNIHNNRVTPHFNLQYTILRGVLVANSDVQFDINNTKQKSFLPQIATGRPITETVVNRAFDGDNDAFNVQTKTNLVYTPKLSADHSFTSLLSFQTYDNKNVFNQAMTSNTASSLLQDPSIDSRTQNQELGIASGAYQTRSLALLINAQYGYKDRYIINAGIRGDGNSRFGPSKRYGLFPSVSARWRVSDEKFMSGFKYINDLSIRASYGLAGNEPRNDYSFYNLYSTYAWNYQGLGGVYSSRIQLDNLKWEVVHGQNIGFNLIMNNRKINVDVDVYRNRTNDLLFYGLTIPTYTGFTSVDMNVGTMDNQGWEVNVMTTVVRNATFTIDFNFNIAHNENLIREISPFYPQSKGVTTSNGQYLAMLQINNPFGSIYGYRFKGVYKDKEATVATATSGKSIYGPNGEPVYMRFNYPKTDYIFQPGDAMYEDINHDGNIDYKDIVYLGNSNPKLSGGFGPTITYRRNLKITAFFNYRTKYDVVNGTKMTTTNMYGFNNQSTAVLRRWRNPGDVTDMPRALWNAGYNWLGSDRYVEDASFLRFRTITVRYNFSDRMVKRMKIKSFSTYLTAENLMTFTRYTGQDPEVAPRGISGPFTIVTDNSTTPPQFLLTLGITGSF